MTKLYVDENVSLQNDNMAYATTVKQCLFHLVRDICDNVLDTFRSIVLDVNYM